MVGMITGAKRYILSPPIECPKVSITFITALSILVVQQSLINFIFTTHQLGVVTSKRHPVYRHSLLNFGHISFLDNTDDEVANMPDLEKEWLNISKTAKAIDTVLKAGEVLYIPSHWFHYIVSLQKSAQCNVRSGRDMVGNAIFGGADDVERCVATEND